MRLEHDVQLTLSLGNSRKSMSWIQTEMPLSGLYERLSNPIRGTENMAAYLALPKKRQDELKDVGGFVGGTLEGPRRLSSKVKSRCLVTLDFDTMPPYSTDLVLEKIKSIGYGFCAYSTRKHRKEAPRMRIVFPLNRPVNTDEYDAISRRLAGAIGIEMADPTTFEPQRLMYWPSCCSDGEYVFQYEDAPPADADFVLGLYTDWHDWEERPRVPGEKNTYKQMAVRQGNPTEKPGVVGAFCRTYNIYSAMDKFLPGIYEPCGTSGDRFTYLNGSTAGGAVVYEDGLFLYSHHATDPCCDRLVNAFDLVRLHLFGDLDEEKDPSLPVNRLPSFTKMCEKAVADPEVIALLTQERSASAAQEFNDIASEEEDLSSADLSPDSPVDESWKTELDLVPKSGAVKPTIQNILIILENDPRLKGLFALNQFAGRGEVLGRLPWMNAPARRMWTDTDSNGVYWYLEKVYALTGRGAIDSALDLHASKHAFNEVQDYINKLVWDGTARLDTMFTDYLGARDTPYTRAVCRKSFTAAIARAMDPGCKYDQMTILCGPQGIGKSTLLFKMAQGKWFNDSIRTFEGKEASELLQGVWLVEIAELDAFRRSDVSRIKQFLSLRADRYRAAYAHNAREFPRRCVFFGTSNQRDFLQDTTGNRRFWPIDVGLVPNEKNAFEDLTPEVIDQIWAEAKMRWTVGEPLYLTDEVLEEAKLQQEEHRDASSQEGAIADFLEQEIPADWDRWSVERRRAFWNGGGAGDTPLVPRQKITAIEIWCELMMRNQFEIKRADSREINSILESIPSWGRLEKVYRCGPYGVQRGFFRLL